MKAVIVPLICLIIGAAGGVFFSHPRGAASSPDSETTAKENTSTLGSALTGAKPSADSPGAAKKVPSPHRAAIADLLQLTPNGHSMQDTSELFQALKNLDAGTLHDLASDLELHPSSDPRHWSLRTAILSQFAKVDPDAAFAHAGSLTKPRNRNTAISVVATVIANENPDKIIALARSVEDRLLLKQLVTSMASSDAPGLPQAALELLKKHKGIDLGWGYNNLFQSLAREDMRAAIGQLDGIPHGQQRDHAIGGIGKAITAENFDTGMAILESLTSTSDRARMLENMITTIAHTDPQKAIKLLDQHGTPSQRWELVGNIASAWLAADPERGQAWVESLESPRDRIAALQDSTWMASSQSDWIAKQISALPINDSTQHLVSNFTQAWARADSPAAAAWIATLPEGGVRNHATGNLMHFWLQSDPATAAEYFTSHSDAGATESSGLFSNGVNASRIAAQWAKTDTQAALAWVESLGDDRRSNAITGLVDQWSQTDPTAAADYVLGLDAETQKGSINMLVTNWASNDLEGAKEWVLQIDDQTMRTAALSAIITGSSRIEPEESAALFTEVTAGLSAKEIRDNFARPANQIASGWAEADPAAAAAWATTLPDAADRPKALQNIVSQWALYEPAAASEWIGLFNNGPDRDGAVLGLLSTISQDDPEASFAWAASLENESQRTSWIQQSVNNWKRTNEAAARAAIVASELPAEERAQLLGGFVEQQPSPVNPPRPDLPSDPFDDNPFD